MRHVLAGSVAPVDGARSVLCAVRMPRDFISVPFSIWGPFLRQIGHRETHMTRDAYTRFSLADKDVLVPIDSARSVLVYDVPR